MRKRVCLPAVISLRTLDRRPVRWTLALLIGAPLTIVTLIFAPLGALVGGSVIAGGSGDLFFVAMIAASVLGALGVLGGWMWLVRSSREMSPKYRRTTVVLLGCGVVGAAILAAWSVGGGSLLDGVLPVAAVALGVLLLVQVMSGVPEQPPT